MSSRVQRMKEAHAQVKENVKNNKNTRVYRDQERASRKELLEKIGGESISNVDEKKDSKRPIPKYKQRIKELYAKDFPQELSPKGGFLYKINDICEKASEEKWKGDWKMALVMEIYFLHMTKIKGRAFRNEFSFKLNKKEDVLQRFKWTRGVIDEAGLERMLKVIYMCIHEPDIIYAHGMFRGDFNVSKLGTHKRFAKVEQLLMNEKYFSSDKLFNIEQNNEEYDFEDDFSFENDSE